MSYEIEMIHNTDGQEWKRTYTVDILAKDRKPVSKWQTESILFSIANALKANRLEHTQEGTE